MLSLNGGAGSGADAGARSTPRKSKAVMAKVERVTEVCNVTSEEAHRVLADCEMDVQRAIERFVSGTCRCPVRTVVWLVGVLFLWYGTDGLFVEMREVSISHLDVES